MGGDAGDKNYWWCAICGLLFWNLDLLKSHQTKGFCGNLNGGSAQKMLVAKVSNNSNGSNSREDLPSKTFPKGTVILLKKERKQRKRRVDAKLDKMKPVVVLIDCVQKTQDGKPTRVVCLDLGRMKPPQVPVSSGGSKQVPGGSKQVPGGSKPSSSGNCTVLTHLLNKRPSACQEAPAAPPGAKAIYVCEHCGMRFTRELLYKAHVPLHGENGNSFFECSVCKKVFAEVNALEHHKYKEYHYVAFYVCQICDSKYINHSLLDYHLTLHSINGTDTFRIKSEKNRTLYLAPKTREEVKRFECGSCGLRFEKEFLMISHFETVHRENHSEEFVCGICSETFVNPESLEWHKSDQNHYDCGICLETFDDNDSLKQHKYDYNHYDSYFVCRFCPRKFTDRRPLDFHQSNIHVLETRWWKDHYKK